MMRTIIALSVVGIAAGAAVVAVQLNVFTPPAPAPVVVTPPPVEDPASAELLKRLEQMDADQERVNEAARAGQEALRKRLESGGGEPQKDPLNW